MNAQCSTPYDVDQQDPNALKHPARTMAKLSRREELLVRLIRSVPLSSDLRAVLAVRASSAGHFAALAVLRALEGDAVAVIGAFLQVCWAFIFIMVQLLFSYRDLSSFFVAIRLRLVLILT